MNQKLLAWKFWIRSIEACKHRIRGQWLKQDLILETERLKVLILNELGRNIDLKLSETTLPRRWLRANTEIFRAEELAVVANENIN